MTSDPLVDCLDMYEVDFSQVVYWIQFTIRSPLFLSLRMLIHLHDSGLGTIWYLGDGVVLPTLASSHIDIRLRACW